MARRYGRNQKRRHREEIARQTARADQAEDARNKILEEFLLVTGDIAEWEADIRSYLGPYSALLPEPARRIVSDLAQPMRLPVRQCLTPVLTTSKDISMTRAMQPVERMCRLMVEVDRFPDQIKHLMRLRVETPDGRQHATLLSESMVNHMSGLPRAERRYLIETIAKNVADQINGGMAE